MSSRNGCWPPIRGIQRGFTLVELLVVIAIIGVLVSLVLPAVQSAREAARKMECLNKCRQLGIAVINFEDSRKRLPPGGVISPISAPPNSNCERSYNFPVTECYDLFGVRGGPTMSWIVLILPFMEEQALHDQFDLTRSIFQQAKTPFSNRIASLICPTDGALGPEYDGSASPANGMGKAFAKGNYAGYVSPVHLNMQRILPGTFGGFEPGKTVGQRLARVVDGTSNTLALTEVRTLDRAWDSRGVWSLPFPGATVVALDWHPVNNQVVAPYRPDPRYAQGVQLPNDTRLGDQLIICREATYAAQKKMNCNTISYVSAAPRSLHLGGVNAVALDGHAGFISDGIDSFMFAYLISVNDKIASSVSVYLQ